MLMFRTRANGRADGVRRRAGRPGSAACGFSRVGVVGFTIVNRAAGAADAAPACSSSYDGTWRIGG